MSALDFVKIASRNKRRTFLLVIILILILFGIGRLLDSVFNGGGVYTIIALTIALIQSLVSYYAGDKIVLSSVRARQPDLGDYEERQFVNVVQELCIAAGIPQPKCYVMDDPSPNAFATGRDPKHASVCATKGLLKVLNREELEGVIGHELSHVKNRDILTMTMVSVLAGAIVIIADLLRYNLFYGATRSRDRDNGGGRIIALLVFIIVVIFATIISHLMTLAVSRAREYMADAGSVSLTRNPLALASALEKISNYSKPMVGISDAVSHFFISDPKKRKLSEKDSLWAISGVPIHQLKRGLLF